MAKTNLKPLFDNILIKPLEAEIKTSSGIILPDSAKEKPQMGEIVEVGPGKMDEGKLTPVSVKKGQKVMYKKWGGNEVKINGEELILVEEKDILAIIE
ncbi:MAG TPA: co-chaperone GroES [Candidatus Sulfotelmatobacter sp.]|nr:co-chaperone GroES [Candidatus Sulfotelmatobacter sp.]